MKYKFNITGIDCPNCAAKLASVIEGADGISSAKINFLTEKLTVESELDAATLADSVIKACKKFSKGIEVVRI